MEKRVKPAIDQVDSAGCGARPACARASSPIGIGTGAGGGGLPLIVRLEGVPATPRNRERIRERIAGLNRRLAALGLPFRLRIV